LQAVVEDRQKIVRHYALKDVVVGEAEANPKAVELRPAQKSFAFRLEVIRKLADKINGTNPGERNLDVLAVRSEDVDRVGLAESRRTEIAAHGGLVQKHDDDFLVRRGWGSVLQRIRTFKNG
jgi:hypothetical protein